LCRETPSVSAQARSQLPREGAFGMAPAPSVLQRKRPGSLLHPPSKRYALIRGCKDNSKGTMRRLCGGFFPLQAEIQKKPPQPEPPRMQPRSAQLRYRRGSGGKLFLVFPRRLCATFGARKWPPSPTEKEPADFTPQATNHRMKFVQACFSFSGSPSFSFPSAMDFIRKLMLRARVRMVCKPSASSAA